jgi:DnaJ family protein C protein 11
MEQLLASRFLPTLNLNVRQEFFWREDARTRALPDLVVEQELELLPQFSMTTRIGHSIDLPGSCEPVNVEICAQKLINHTRGVAPSLGLAVHRRVGPGTAFLVADGGNWNIWPSKECRELSQFSKISGGFAPMLEAFRNPPTLEAGYSFGRHDLGIQSGQAFTKPSERGLAAIDCDLDENKTGSWTVSTGLTPGNAAAYLRYGRDLLSSLTPSTTPRQKKTGVRAEVELSGSGAQRDFFLAFRALKRIGRFSKAGLEVGISPTNLHLSLYWSRLGQRISLPFLVATTKARFSTKLLFWTTVFPFATLAAWELYRQRQQRVKAAAAAKSLASTLNREKKLHEYINRRRAEADELTVVLATGVEPRQAAERQRGGLVIVSAKYGVRDAPPDEVADVTIAVAALVDGEGRLVIPGGLRKSRLLGFWDPAPMGTKVLRVRYMWRGEERAVEVCGRGELRLP